MRAGTVMVAPPFARAGVHHERLLPSAQGTRGRPGGPRLTGATSPQRLQRPTVLARPLVRHYVSSSASCSRFSALSGSHSGQNQSFSDASRLSSVPHCEQAFVAWTISVTSFPSGHTESGSGGHFLPRSRLG